MHLKKTFELVSLVIAALIWDFKMSGTTLELYVHSARKLTIISIL